MTPQERFREDLVAFLEWELVGPGDPFEELNESPRTRYSAGVLFPRQQEYDETEDSSPDEAEVTSEAPTDGVLTGESEEQEFAPTEASPAVDSGIDYDSTVQLANACLPAAMGLSFIVEPEASHLAISVRAATYRKAVDADGRPIWRRQPLEAPVLDVDLHGQRLQSLDVTEHLKVDVTSRPRHDRSRLVTVSLWNAHPPVGGQRPPVERCFFQVGFEVASPRFQFAFREYRLGHHRNYDEEDESLDLLYRNRRAFAIGHGCAADWQTVEDGRTDVLSTATMPRVTLAPLKPRQDQGDEYSMFFLSGGGGSIDAEVIPTTLRGVVSAYEKWIAAQISTAGDLEERYRDAAQRHLEQCRQCCERMREGIDLLSSDPQAREAFMLANRAMLMQQSHAGRPRRKRNDDFTPLPTSYDSTGTNIGQWRAFQLAFILMNLRALTEDGLESNSPRNSVDLIWFPTGGGKTEAYLGLASFAIFLRRLRDPRDSGCTVLMRYTLRLLTAQQFQRAAALICACDVIRDEMPDRLGTDPISIGLWVGSSLTPNTIQDANHRLSEWVRGRGENPFQILTCPWCGTALDDRDHPGYRSTGQPRCVRAICPESRCVFHSPSRPLPILMIDELIYGTPPELIIGTVDKFAMLAWNDRAGAIFGKGSSIATPPDLIIQDELHLIAGPLGSVVGLYESVIDLLCSSEERRPKIVASTATVRGAADQCWNLYRRDTFVFPPPGLDITDSYFAREDTASPGRLYVGVFGTAAASPIVASLRTIAALLQGAKAIALPEGTDESVRDPYWTVVWYFNSLRELGQANTLVEADIVEYIQVIRRRLNLDRSQHRHIGRPVELTSRRTADEIPEILKRMQERHPSGDVIDTLLSTNMISVGVDIPRLGLMAVAGQPKATSEYIQATSRVGRSGDAPGLVVTTLVPGKPRDRSHYEHFREFHESYYRFVEPTSVTPFSLPTIDRALHALVVIVARHLCGLPSPSAFVPSASEIGHLRQWLADRCGDIDPEHQDYLLEQFDILIGDWDAVRPAEWGTPYGPPDPDVIELMVPAGQAPGEVGDDFPRATLTSMRNVDVECQATVLSRYTSPDGHEDEGD